MKKVTNMIEALQNFLLKLKEPRKPSEQIINNPFFYYMRVIWNILKNWFLIYVLAAGCVSLPSIWLSLKTFTYQSKDLVLTAEQLQVSSIIVNRFLVLISIFVVIVMIAINPEKGLNRFFGVGRWYRKRYLSQFASVQITRNLTDKTNLIIYTPSEAEKHWMDKENIDAYQVIVKEGDKAYKVSVERKEII
ncbi:hypothetical protein FACS1894192_08120 [Bacilli bacterium]|nr:hypothetical protein FACS1894192_08120 [Bacilli bacterium]